MTVVMEIKAPHGSCRIEAFPTMEDYYWSELAKSLRRRMSYQTWVELNPDIRFGIYFNAQKRITAQHSQGVRAFMKQHRCWGKK